MIRLNSSKRGRAADAGETSVPTHPEASVDAAVRAAGGGLAGQAARQAVALSLNAMPGLQADVDQDRLEELIGSVLSFAIGVAPQSGHIALRCFRSDGAVRVLVEIADNPDARYLLAEEDADATAEMPVELDPARALAQEMGGDIETTRWPRVRRFTITVPAAAEAA